MSNEASLDIKIAVDTGPVKTNLDRVREEFRSVSAGISTALKSIQGFAEIKKQTEEMTSAYGEAQRKVAELAKEIKTGGGGEALAKDFEQAKAAAARLKEGLAGQQQELQRVRSAMAAAGVSTTGLSGHQQKLRAELDQTRAKYQELANIANARDTLGLRPHAEVQAAIRKTRDAYGELARSGKLSLAELAQAKVAMRTKIDELTRSTNGWRDALSDIKGRALEVGATIAGLVAASRTAISFESAMADVSKTVDGTKEELKALGGELRNMSHTIPLSADQLARIAASGGQLGIAAGDISQFAQTTAKMAVAFDMTADAAGDSIGKIKNVYKLTIPEVEGLGDSINQLGNTTAARERDIVDVMLRVGGTANQFGLAKEKTAALAAAMLSLGKAPEVASTSINAMLNRMQTATMQTGEFQDALGKIGMTADEMAEAVAANPQKALDDLLETLSKLSGRERAEVLTGLFGKEFQDDIGVLVGSLGTYKDAMGQVADATKFAGAMNKEFETRSATTENQLQLLKNVVMDIVRGVGDGFLPAINAGAEVLHGLLLPVAALVREFPQLTAIVATVGAGFVVFNTATRTVDILRMAITKIGPASIGSFGQAGTAVSKFTGLLGAAGKLLAAFGVGWELGTFFNKSELVQKGMTGLIHTADLLQLGARKMWAALTGGDTAEIERKIEIAKKAYEARLKEIEQESADKSKPIETPKAPAIPEPEPPPLERPKSQAEQLADKSEADAKATWKDEWLTPEEREARNKERAEKGETVPEVEAEDAKQSADEQIAAAEEVAAKKEELRQEDLAAQEKASQEEADLRRERHKDSLAEMERDSEERKAQAESESQERLDDALAHDEELRNQRAQEDEERRERNRRAAEERRQENEEYNERLKQEDEAAQVKPLENNAADDWADAQATATEKATSAFQKYFDKVKSIQDEISGREKSLAEELDGLDARGTEESRWRKRAKDAKDYEKAARAAMKAGDLDQALSFSDKAKELFGSLRGGAGKISDEMGQRSAYSGVKSTGELGLAIERMLQQVSAKGALAAISGNVPGGNAAAGDARGQVSKVHELRFAGAALQGGEDDIEKFLRGLEKAGMQTA